MATKQQVKIDPSWYMILADEFEKPYFQDIKTFLRQEKEKRKIIYPPGPLIFNAFNTTPFDKVKVVIIGQDPYHGPGQAMGLSFSVPKGVRIPHSLINIYKEIERDLGYPIPQHGDLTSWAEQGVFLLNAMLTVEDGKAGAHKNIGWQLFTDAVIHKLSVFREGLVFMLWGNFARKKKELINTDKHFILESPHPSPLAGNGFYGNGHFSKANGHLIKTGVEPIDWNPK
jgi:uracil-DNA glycosylase